MVSRAYEDASPNSVYFLYKTKNPGQFLASKFRFNIKMSIVKISNKNTKGAGFNIGMEHEAGYCSGGEMDENKRPNFILGAGQNMSIKMQRVQFSLSVGGPGNKFTKQNVEKFDPLWESIFRHDKGCAIVS